LFRSGFFGLFKWLGAVSGSSSLVKVAEVLTQAHVLGFGILVVLVILVLPNGIVGDWEKIKRGVFRIKTAS
jgi:branched-chain amino acid transport system permease protein